MARLFFASVIFATAAVALLSPARAAEVSVAWAGPTDRPAVALTFDDGPTPGVTDGVLDKLADVGARATFFVVGERIEREGEAARRLIRRMKEEGHEVGNHSWTHSSFTKLSRSGIIDEVGRSQKLLREILGSEPTRFRPPGGALSVDRIRMLSETGLKGIVMWSVDPSDWSGKSAAQIWEHLAPRIEPGSIILLHDIRRETLTALPLILDLIQARGYELVTVSELLGE